MKIIKMQQPFKHIIIQLFQWPHTLSTNAIYIFIITLCVPGSAFSLTQKGFERVRTTLVTLLNYTSLPLSYMLRCAGEAMAMRVFVRCIKTARHILFAQCSAHTAPSAHGDHQNY